MTKARWDDQNDDDEAEVASLLKMATVYAMVANPAPRRLPYMSQSNRTICLIVFRWPPSKVPYRVIIMFPMNLPKDPAWVAIRPALQVPRAMDEGIFLLMRDMAQDSMTIVVEYTTTAPKT